MTHEIEDMHPKRQLETNSLILDSTIQSIKNLNVFRQEHTNLLRDLSDDELLRLNRFLLFLFKEKMWIGTRFFKENLADIIEYDADREDMLEQCIKVLAAIDPLFGCRGEDNSIELLVKLNKEQLTQIKNILKAILPHAQGDRRPNVEYLIFYAENFADKADSLIICLNAMNSAGISLTGTCVDIFRAMSKKSLGAIVSVLTQFDVQFSTINDGRILA